MVMREKRINAGSIHAPSNVMAFGAIGSCQETEHEMYFVLVFGAQRTCGRCEEAAEGARRAHFQCSRADRLWWRRWWRRRWWWSW